MPYRTMSLKEFAQFVGLDARDVQREADRGQLPGRKVGGKWRFNRAQVHEWLDQHMPTQDEKRLGAFDSALARSARASEMIVTDMIGVESIELTLRASTKTSVLHELVNLAQRTGLVYDGQGLFEALRQREEMVSTALPNGTAIPHPRAPMPYATAEPLICVARVPNPIAFGAPGGSLTRLFILICNHDNEAHLHVLARLMRMLEHELVEDLLAIEDPAGALELMIAYEERIVKSLRRP